MTETNDNTSAPLADDKALGAILGALTGDAMGATLEFLGHTPTTREVDQAMAMTGGGHFGLAPGQITDDGELTLALLDHLACGADYPPKDVARAYFDWAASRPFDIGIATTRALREVDGTRPELAAQILMSAQKHNAASKANGALMRASPLGVWGARLPLDKVLLAARFDARLTHPHPICQHANAAYVTAIRHLVLHPGDAEGAIQAARGSLSQGEPDRAAGTFEGTTLATIPPTVEVRQWINDALAGSLPPFEPQPGYLRIAFTLAFYHLSHHSDMPTAMRQVLSGGGDTDTNACIVGGLVGARVGASHFPGLWRKAVPGCDSSTGRQPRPRAYSAAGLEQRVQRLLS